ncbi:MAG: antitoxin [Deltaproteobacteria bacterium]|nr:antitoxin [Deltaproteobacteria bacterium]
MSATSTTSRLQVLLDRRDYRALREVAKQQGLSLGEWVRRVLRQAAQVWSPKPTVKKIQAIRRAAKGEYPTAEIGQMLSEIEHGYLRG